MARKRKNKAVKLINWLAAILMIVGGITWGTIGLPQLFGFSGFNLVAFLFSSSVVSSIIYSLVGVSSLWFAFSGLLMKSMK